MHEASRSQKLQLGTAGSGESELQRLVRIPALLPKASTPLLQNVCERARVLLLLRPHRRLALYCLIQHRCLPHFPPMNLPRRRSLSHQMRLSGSRAHSRCFRQRSGVLLGARSSKLGRISRSVMSLRRWRCSERRIALNASKYGCGAGGLPPGSRQLMEFPHTRRVS